MLDRIPQYIWKLKQTPFLINCTASGLWFILKSDYIYVFVIVFYFLLYFILYIFHIDVDNILGLFHQLVQLCQTLTT
jgi:hypothetical protein